MFYLQLGKAKTDGVVRNRKQEKYTKVIFFSKDDKLQVCYIPYITFVLLEGGTNCKAVES